MRQRTAILLIGAMLTVGLSLVVEVGVGVVDQDGTAEYRSTQTPIDDASAGDTARHSGNEKDT